MKTALSPKLPAVESSRSRSTDAAPAPAPKPAVNAARPAQSESLFDQRSGGGAAEKVKSLFKLPDVGGWWDRHVERPFVMGRDGFVAVDPGGKIAGGQPPTAQVRDHDFFKTPLDPLLEEVKGGEAREVTFRLPGGASF